jgi:hypothetical protein
MRESDLTFHWANAMEKVTPSLALFRIAIKASERVEDNYV